MYSCGRNIVLSQARVGVRLLYLGWKEFCRTSPVTGSSRRVSLADSSLRLDLSRAWLMHRIVQLGPSITPSYDTNSEATTLLTNISFVCWVELSRQEEP